MNCLSINSLNSTSVCSSGLTISVYRFSAQLILWLHKSWFYSWGHTVKSCNKTNSYFLQNILAFCKLLMTVVTPTVRENWDCCTEIITLLTCDNTILPVVYVYQKWGNKKRVPYLNNVSFAYQPPIGIHFPCNQWVGAKTSTSLINIQVLRQV